MPRLTAKMSPFGLVFNVSSLLWQAPDKVIRWQMASASYANHCIGFYPGVSPVRIAVWVAKTPG